MLPLGIFLFIAVIIFIAKGVIIVQQAEVIIVEKFGKYDRTLESGLNFIMPIMENIREIQWKVTRTTFEGKSIQFLKNMKRIDLRETVYDFPRQNVITSDNVTIEINALLYFQITDAKKAVYEINNLPDAIEKLTQTTLRNVIGELELDKTLTSRDTINTKLRSILDDATDKWGVKVNRVELQDIVPPKEIREAMEKQMRAERDKRASILTAEGDKQSNILKSEGVKASKILEAEGVAAARLRMAEAEAEAIRKVNEAVSSGNTTSVNYLVALKYIEAFKNLADGANDKVVFMPFESTSLLSTVGSIKELLTVDKANTPKADLHKNPILK